MKEGAAKRPWAIKAPAKLNIRLKVTGRRPDGYHELVSIMVPVDLCDLLEIEIIPKGVRVQSGGFPVPQDEGNLVAKAARLFLAKAREERGVSLRLEKRIPVAAGMGGGSSDAAAALMVMNTMWGNPLSPAELHEAARSLGADVPFFLACRPAIATGIGDILEPIPGWPEFRYVIVTPRLPVSTAWVYGNLQLNELTRDEYSHIKSMLRGHPVAIGRILENDLESVTSARFPIIEAVKHSLLELGAEGALMTGSGPSVFGIFSSLEQAEAARQSLVSRNLGDVFLARQWEREGTVH